MASKGLFGGLLDPVAEGLFGGNTDAEDAKAKAALDAAFAEYNGLEAPNVGDIELGRYQWQGDLSPAARVTAPHLMDAPDVGYDAVDPRLAELFLADDSAMNDIGSDPRLRGQQMAGLDALDEVVQGQGLRASDRAALSKVQSDAAQADKGRRDAIMSGAAARGMGGSGMELLAQLQSSQAATDRANQSGLDIAGMAQDRELQAIMQSGQLAGDIRGQDFGEEAEIAAANDLMDRFNKGNSNQNAQFNANTVNDAAFQNAGNKLRTDTFNADKTTQGNLARANFAFDADRTNAGAANDAATRNWQARQDTANANVDTANKQLVQNKIATPQDRFDNASKVASGKAGAHGQQANYWTSMGDREASKAAGRADLVGKAVAGGYSAYTNTPADKKTASDERVKKDVVPLSDEDLHEFLGAVQPKKFKYKNPGKPGQKDGDRIGFLLQDVQGTKIGDAITEQDEKGSMYFDKDNLDGVILAAMSSLAKGRKKS